MPKVLLAALAVLLTVWTVPAGADEPAAKGGMLRIESAWARPTAPAAANGAAYFVIHDEGKEPDKLVRAGTPVAKVAELHTHLVEGNVMRMRPVEAIEVHPGTPTVLQPGGLHVMLMGLKAPLKEGERFPLTLVFEKAGEVTVEVAIQRQAPGSGGMPQPGPQPGSQPGHGMGGPGHGS